MTPAEQMDAYQSAISISRAMVKDVSNREQNTPGKVADKALDVLRRQNEWRKAFANIASSDPVAKFRAATDMLYGIAFWDAHDNVDPLIKTALRDAKTIGTAVAAILSCDAEEKNLYSRFMGLAAVCSISKYYTHVGSVALDRFASCLHFIGAVMKGQLPEFGFSLSETPVPNNNIVNSLSRIAYNVLPGGSLDLSFFEHWKETVPSGGAITTRPAGSAPG